MNEEGTKNERMNEEYGKNEHRLHEDWTKN